MTTTRNDTFVANLGGNTALLYDAEVGQWILARDVRHTKSKSDFDGFAYWRDGLDKLGREVRRRQSYMRLKIASATLKTLPRELHFLSLGEPTDQELVFG